MLNRVILIGRLVADPIIKYTPTGIQVAQMRVAVNRPLSAEARNQGTEPQADFIDVVAWRQSAEFAERYLNKGRLVAVEGKLQVREYEVEGQRRKAYEVVADNLKGLDKAGQNEDGGGQAAGGYDEYEQPRQAAARPAATGGGGYERAPAAAPARGGYQQQAPAAGRARTAPQEQYEDDLSDPFAE
jgi:single-strand DNA-binding protein